MKTKRKTTKFVVSVLAVAILLVCSLKGYAGNLEPSAAPGPTMKTLDEVEPRIPIHASDLPLTITEPNSYYLAENITTGGSGITIDANNVTIDLMGFALSGGGGSGIYVNGPQKNIAIKNGTVSGWSSRGVSALGAINSQFTNLRASDNGSDGLGVGIGSTVTNCTARDNGGDGIELGMGMGIGSTVTNCTVVQNGGNGIFASHGSTVISCTVSFNTSDGIYAVMGSTVTNCTVRANTGDGIKVSSDCRVVGNNCNYNGKDGDGAGIHVTSTNSDNRIEGNNVTDNDRGIDVDFGGNLIIKNSASSNGTNYDIVAGNTVGPILGVADPIASTNPWANFSF